MKYIIGLAILSICCVSHSDDIESNIAFGNVLTEAVKSKSSIKMKSLDNYKEVKGFLKQNKCPGFKYKAYSIPESNRFYLVASKGKSVIIGRHFVGSLQGNSVDVSSLISSTNGCINLGSPKKDAAAMFVTHLKPEPNEFHVLQSNLANISLYVSTKDTLYSVSNGDITTVEK